MTAKTKTTRKTLVKPGNCTEAYVPGEDLIMRWNKLWKITSVMYSPATKQTYIRLVLPGMKNGANFLRDVVGFLDTRKETLNDDKTVKDLIHEFLYKHCPTPGYYGDIGEDFLGFTKRKKTHKLIK